MGWDGVDVMVRSVGVDTCQVYGPSVLFYFYFFVFTFFRDRDGVVLRVVVAVAVGDFGDPRFFYYIKWCGGVVWPLMTRANVSAWVVVDVDIFDVVV